MNINKLIKQADKIQRSRKRKGKDGHLTFYVPPGVYTENISLCEGLLLSGIIPLEKNNQGD